MNIKGDRILNADDVIALERMGYMADVGTSEVKLYRQGDHIDTRALSPGDYIEYYGEAAERLTEWIRGHTGQDIEVYFYARNEITELKRDFPDYETFDEPICLGSIRSPGVYVIGWRKWINSDDIIFGDPDTYHNLLK